MDRRTLLAGLAAAVAVAPDVLAQDRQAAERLARRAADLMTTAMTSPRLDERMNALLAVIDVVFEMHDLQVRARSLNPQILLMAATFILGTPSSLDVTWMYSSAQYVTWARRLRTQALGLHQRLNEAAGAFAALGANTEWQAHVRSNGAATLVHVAAILGERAQVAEAIAALDPGSNIGSAAEQAEKARSRALGELFVGRNEAALASAAAAALHEPARAQGPGAPIYTGQRDCNAIAAMAAARLGQWRTAWTRLVQARGTGDGSAETLERGLWSAFDGAMALVTTKAGTQIWFASRTGGLDGTQCLELAGLRRNDLQRFMGNDAHLGEGALGRPDQGWLLASAIGDDRRATEAFRRRLTTPNVPEALSTAFAQAASALVSAGVERVAWMPTSAVAQFPASMLPLPDGRPASAVLRIATVLNPGDLARAAAGGQTIGRADALRIDGGDETIPLARVERQLVGALPQREDGGRVLHIAAHAMLPPGEPNIKIQTGTRRWMTVAQLMRASAWRPTPRLVILSACRSMFDVETVNEGDNLGSGPGQEMIAGGAYGVIGSTWEVNDLASFLLATRIEVSMLVARQAPLAAFGEAVNWLRTSPPEALSAHVEEMAEASLLESAAADDVLGRIAELSDPIPFAHPIHWAAWTFWGA